MRRPRARRTAADVRERERAFWFDFSTSTRIECVLESLAAPLADGALASVHVYVANASALLDAAGLAKDLAGARRNFNCATLSHCEALSAEGLPAGWFGAGWAYDGAAGSAAGGAAAFRFASAATPVVTGLFPARGMPGQLVDIRGRGLAAAGPQLDTNWYMSEFGFFEQPKDVAVQLGTYQCKVAFANDTLIQCWAVYGAM